MTKSHLSDESLIDRAQHRDREAPRGIILIEGADAAGKTTLARHLVERYGAKYIHSTVRKNVWKWHVGALKLAHRYAKTRLVVLDRHWPSEQAYGQVYRGGPAYDLGARCADRVLLGEGCLTILCVPIDVEAQIKRHAALKESRKEHFAEIERVAHLYCDLAVGANLAHPGNTYLDQLIRFGDYKDRADVTRYSIEVEGLRMEKWAEGQIRWLKRLRGNAEMLGPGIIGSLAASRYLFLGDGPSSYEVISPIPPWPFFHDDSPSAVTWVNRALHELAFDETKGLWANAHGQGANLSVLAARRPDLRVIALGRIAEGEARKRWRDVRLVPYPKDWKWVWHDDPEKFKKAFEEAMR